MKHPGRPDFSDYVVHFTKGSRPLGRSAAGDRALEKISALSALERLTKILKERNILATQMPWTGKPAVCFTECTWVSLLDHSKRYSPFGVGFSKAFLFATGAAPAIYLRPDFLDWQNDHTEPKDPFDDRLWSFVTPFAPDYAPKAKKDLPCWQKFKDSLDFSHEREWRVPHNLTFHCSDVAFVIVNSYEDLARMPKPIKDGLGRQKFLIMDIYRQIEKLWPTHMLSGGDKGFK
ncbi:MAG: terminase [Acidobacteriota bacterium]|nr:terminase [Acidobacteriota bacterium]